AALNGEHGEARGDRVLQDVATIVSHAVRSTDVVARLEGDQFLIIAPRLNAQGAQALGDRLLAKVRRHRFPMPGRRPLELTPTVEPALLRISLSTTFPGPRDVLARTTPDGH